MMIAAKVWAKNFSLPLKRHSIKSANIQLFGARFRDDSALIWSSSFPMA